MEKKTPSKTVCRVPRAAEILGVPSHAAVYMQCQRGLIPHRKVGKRILFFEEELIEFLERQPGVNIEQALAAR